MISILISDVSRINYQSVNFLINWGNCYCLLIEPTFTIIMPPLPFLSDWKDMLGYSYDPKKFVSNCALSHLMTDLIVISVLPVE